MPASASAQEPGQEVYDRWCAACHGAVGEGTVIAPGLTSPELHFVATDAYFYETITADWISEKPQALRTAARLMQGGGADMVKLEGGGEQLDSVRRMSGLGVSVCGLLGLQPDISDISATRPISVA